MSNRDLCLFKNYDLNSVSSIVKFARHTANCLVYRYISENAPLTKPRVIKELCLYYFVGGKYFMQDFREDLLYHLNENSKIELFQLVLNIIYPGNQNIGLMLAKLIHFCHVNHAPGYKQFLNNNYHFSKEMKSLCLSMLISLTNVIDFYQTLNEITSQTYPNYNKLILNVSKRKDCEQGMQLVHKLLQQNSEYYPLYLDQLLQTFNLILLIPSTHTKYNDKYLLSIACNVLSQIQSVPPHQSHHSMDIAVEILYVITEMYQVNMQYKITNLDNFLEFITFALRSNESSIIAWKILNIEIDKLLIDKCYKYYNGWILYIESKCGLLQSNFVNKINIIKNKCKGNKTNAQKQLEIATKTCYNINKLQSLELKKFTIFYKKINKTKLLKPILQNL